MSAVAMVRLVMAREIRQRTRTKGFAITTALLCVGVLGTGVLSRVLKSDDSPTRYDVAVIGDVPAAFIDVAQQTAGQLSVRLRIHDVSSRVVAEQQIQDGTLDVVVDGADGELVSKGSPPDQLAASMNAAWQAVSSQRAAEAAGLDATQISTILSPSALHTTLLDPGGDDDDSVAQLVGIASAILLFISINAFGGLVLTGVVEEKSTGVVEVLLAHVRAHQLLTGKVLGIGTVAMMQLACTIVCALVALRISGTSVPNGVWVALPTSLFWFVCGFVLYSTLFALAGSFVSRQEDAQGAAAPISMLFTAGYILVFALGSNPYSTAARIVSVLPPFAPLLMPLRVAVGAASVAEIAAAAVLLVAAMFGMLRLAGSVYGRTLLHRGARLRWKQALRMRSG